MPGTLDGDASTGPRDDLDELIRRMTAGDAAAAEEWESAYRTWAAAPAPPQQERSLPSPTDAELHGPHTRYIVPVEGGGTETVVRGRAPPKSTIDEVARLARYRQQTWRIAADGRSICCREGAAAADSSVIVQLYASALPIAVASFDRDTAAKATRRAAVNDRRNRAGLDPLPVDTPTA